MQKLVHMCLQAAAKKNFNMENSDLESVSTNTSDVLPSKRGRIRSSRLQDYCDAAKGVEELEGCMKKSEFLVCSSWALYS